jgi:hypothetical protein
LSRPRWMPGWRKMTWVILIFNALMLTWIIAGSVDTANNCAGEVGDALDACQTGTAVGSGIAIFLIILLTALGDFILGVLWLVTRSSRRDCPVCGSGVTKGVTVCGNCRYDFVAAHQAQAASAPPVQAPMGFAAPAPAWPGPGTPSWPVPERVAGAGAAVPVGQAPPVPAAPAGRRGWRQH